MIKKILQESFILKENGHYKHAIESFYKALEIDNKSTELLLEIAECYYLIGEEERTLNYIEQILQDNPTHIGALKLLKRIFINKKAWTEAEQTAKNIYCISKDTNDLAEILEFLNKQKRFSDVFDYEIQEPSSEILYQQAFAALNLNKINEAIEYIDKALNIDFNEKNIFLKCKILYKTNRKDECVELFKNININNTDAETLNFAGLIKQYECEFSNAIDFFKKAIKISPQKDDYFYNCASTYFKMGNISLAKKYYNLAISLAPENQNYHFALANLYYSEKHYKRALEELNYDFFEAKLLKSIILYESGYLTIAKREIEKLSKEQPENELIREYKNKIEEELKI